jgi:hypothetical protein
MNSGYTLISRVSLRVYLEYHLHSEFMWSRGARGYVVWNPNVFQAPAPTISAISQSSNVKEKDPLLE